MAFHDKSANPTVALFKFNFIEQRFADVVVDSVTVVASQPAFVVTW